MKGAKLQTLPIQKHNSSPSEQNEVDYLSSLGVSHIISVNLGRDSRFQNSLQESQSIEASINCTAKFRYWLYERWREIVRRS